MATIYRPAETETDTWGYWVDQTNSTNSITTSASAWGNWVTNATGHVVIREQTVGSDDTVWVNWVATQGTASTSAVWTTWSTNATSGTYQIQRVQPNQVTRATYPLLQQAQLTPEQIENFRQESLRAEERRRLQDIELAERRAENERKAKDLEAKRKAALVKAERTLLGLLTPEQEKAWLENRHIFVTSPSGKRYRIKEGMTHNFHEVDEMGRLLKEFCAHVHYDSKCNNIDNVIAQFLALRCNEAMLVKKSNIWKITDQGKKLIQRSS